MSAVTPAQAAFYLARWAAVAEKEILELRQMPVAQKMRQLNALFAGRSLFPSGPAEPREADALCRRWAKIRAACRDQPTG